LRYSVLFRCDVVVEIPHRLPSRETLGAQPHGLANVLNEFLATDMDFSLRISRVSTT
jgi:hypothetical protein